MSRSTEQLEQIAAFADALPAAIWVGRAPSGECVYVNRAFNVVLGIQPPEEAARGNYVGPYGVHRPTGEPYPESEMPYEQVMRARAPVIIDDIVIHRHDGKRTYLRVFASPIFDDAGEIAYVVEAFTDMTGEVEANEARREGDRRLQVAQRLDAIGSLAGGIAHDFNNLLSIVKLVAAELGEGESDPARLEMVRYLDEVADSAAKLTRALLGFAQRGKHLTQVIDLRAIAASVVELARRTFARRLVVTAELDQMPTFVEGDESQLEQVVMNLVMNARDAIGDEEGHLVVRTRRGTLGEGAHPDLAPGDYVILEVEDSGPGIEPSIRERVFEPYVTTKNLGPMKGTGLGLATVYGIARAHGGLAEIVASGPGGTTMRVYFSAAVSTAAQPTPPATQGRAAQPVRGTGGVLVVDDEPLILRTTAITLERLGYTPIPFTRGDLAVAALRERPHEIVAAVLDMTMPGMSARDTFAALTAAKPGLAVVLMTGAAMNEEAQQLLDMGVRGFLQKPFDANRLSRMLADALAAGGC